MTGPLEIEQFAFNPAQGLRSHTYSPTEPESEEAIRNQIQGIPDQLRDHINHVQEILAGTDADDSGAEYIGAPPIAGITARDVANQLIELKGLIDGLVVGQIPDGSLTGAKLAADAVTGAKIADGSVSAEHITAGAVGTGKLEDECVTEGKIADGAVTEDKLADGAVTTDKLGTIAGIVKTVQITASGNWTVPKNGLYRVTLIGGGGGGGAGFYANNSSLSYPKNWFAGAGGAASIPVTKEFYFGSGSMLTFEIGAAGAGRTTNNMTVSKSGSTYVISSCDAEASAGGESKLKYGTTELLATSSRVAGNSYNVVSTSSSGYPLNMYGGQPGSGLIGADSAESVYTSSSLEGKAGKLGGGNGGGYTQLSSSSTAENHGGDATWYGCGGGGGGATYSKTSAINCGGDGGSGIAIIEYTL